MKTIDLAPGLHLPADEAVSQKYAFIGRSGSGKSYTAGKLVECLLDAGAQVVVVDPVGIHYGLRLAADGKSPGVQVPIFGGQHGDIPLEATAGAVVADLVASRSASLILDVSEFSGGEQRRFVADFAEHLLHGKKRHRSPVLVVWEESQEFIPERVFKDAARMVGAMQRLVKIGRNFGVGTALVTQRPQAVSKEVLNQTETLFVFQTTGPHERKAIEGWIVEHGLDLKRFVDELPSLEQGTGYLWSPQWLRKFQKVRVHLKRTFDASATPTLSGKVRKAVELAPVELAQIQEAMAATVARAKENDPRELKRRIAELERQLKARPTTPTVETKIERVEVPVLANGQLNAFEAVVKELVETGQTITAALARVGAVPVAVPRPRPVTAQRTTVPPTPRKTTSSPASSDYLPIGERKVLAALIQYPDGLRREQLTVLTGYKRSSRDAYVQRLREKGYVDTSGERLTATAAGIAALPDAQPLPTGTALQDYWRERLPQGERAILDVLIQHFPATVDRDFLKETTGYKRSSRDAYLARLGAKELVTEPARGQVQASDNLFD